MPDLSILNVLIAMVIVILVLSLVVQSIQTVVKKALKLKSRQILHSLEDLFETIADRPTTAPDPNTKTAQQLVADVTNRLKEMGRKSIFGKPMLDSLAKGDLLKVLTRVRAEDLLPGAVGNFQAVLAGINELKDEIAEIETNLLRGEASAKFAAMQGSIMPLLHDLEALASGGNIDPAVFFGDLYRLRQIRASEVLQILGEVQESVSADVGTLQESEAAAQQALAGAQRANNEAEIAAATEREKEANGRLTAVKSVDSGLKNIAGKITALSTAFDAAFAPLFARLEQVEVWYDTVMQGFEERYNRHMRTAGIVISIIVVVLLNANFFSVYRALQSDTAKTEMLVDNFQKNPGIIKGEPPAPSAPATSAPAGTPGGTASASPVPTQSPVEVQDIQKEVARMNQLIGTYQTFGLKPWTGQQIHDYWYGDEKIKGGIESLLGWTIMIMLLSAGAPFWQDTLESLFGLKNLLRQKSGTRNVEEDKGGQPKP